MVVSAAIPVLMFVRFEHAVDAQVYAYSDEENSANMAEPFLEITHFLRQVSYADRAVADEPCNQHDRQTGSETEDHRHQPVPRARKRQRDINHRQEIDQPVRAESDREEDTEDERP